MGAQPGRAWPAWRRVHRKLPSGLQGSGLPRFATTPPPQFANCKLRQSQLRHAKGEMQRENGGAKQFRTERPREGGRDWRSKAWISPHPWIPGLLIPTPCAPGSALAKVGWKGELERRPGGRPPSRPIVPGLREAAPLGLPPPKFRAQSGHRAPPPFQAGVLCV